jgi:hypothetical protein
VPRLSTAERRRADEGATGDRPPKPDHAVRRAALIATAVTLPIFVLLALLFTRGGTSDDSGKVQVSPPPKTAACNAFMASLPGTIQGLQSVPTTPSDPQVKAWGDPAFVLRCGVPRPPGLVAGSDALMFGINDVTWLPNSGDATPDPSKPTVLTAVDRDVYIELTLPPNQQTDITAPISTLITAAFPTALCSAQTTGTGPIVPDDQLCTHRP